jgi:hypothetical protein
MNELLTNIYLGIIIGELIMIIGILIKIGDIIKGEEKK